MKTTIKLTGAKSLTVEPCRNADLIALTRAQRDGANATSEADYLTPDQAEVLIYGLEQALEVMHARANAALIERADHLRGVAFTAGIGALDRELRQSKIRQQFESECA